MKKIKKIFKISLFMLAFVCIFFPLSNFNSFTSSASISGISGNRITLTGLVGNNPQHYFVNDNNESTLNNIEVFDSGESHYSLRQASYLATETISSGWAELKTTVDMNELINKGLVYAQATTILTAKSENPQSNIRLTISAGENSTEIESNNKNNETLEIKTPLLKLKEGDSLIRFSFATLEETTYSAKSNFIMEMPAIRLYTEINNVVFENQNEVVTPGQTIKLKAYNDISSINNASGNFLAYSKVNHQIKYEFTSGGEYVDVVGDNMILKNSIPNGTNITFRAYSYKNSYSKEKLYSSNTVTFTVNSNKVNVKVNTDFSDPATIRGEGLYNSNSRITLNIRAKSGYSFEGWYLNDNFLSKKSKIVYTVKQGDNIYAKFIKDITVSKVVVPNKTYDGTVDVLSNDIGFEFNGQEQGHELFLKGLGVEFANVNAGSNKAIVYSNLENVVLDGKDKDIYRLSSNILPPAQASILPRELEICPVASEKEYGDSNPEYKFTTKNLLAGDVVTGSLGREEGESIGEYLFNQGSLNESNPNYKISVVNNGKKFKIVQRTLSFSNPFVEDKIYDRSTDAVVKGQLDNIYKNEDVSIKLKAKYNTVNVGVNLKVEIAEYSLEGKDKGNYKLDSFEKIVYGNILPKKIIVKALETTSVYGDEIKLNYTVEGMFAGEKLTGSLAVEENNVGKHEITINTLSNPNYEIDFKSAKHNITPRNISVYANKTAKTYGDNDPKIYYTVEKLINNDVLQGELSREQGENIGQYDITIGSLQNINYTINLISNKFEIKKRPIIANIKFLDKEYNGLNNVEYEVNFENNIFKENFSIILEASTNGLDAGNQEVTITSIGVNGSNLENYIFTYDYQTMSIVVNKRKVLVEVEENLSKIYGEKDPQLSYVINNMIDGDNLRFNIKRNIGEDVGVYSYYLENINSEENRNYQISLASGMSFNILPKDIKVYTENISKVYGEKDPEFVIKISAESQLAFNDKYEDVINGTLKRENGESVGVYQFLCEEVSNNKNYIVSMKENNTFAISKRDVKVYCEDATKIYGSEDPTYLYRVVNDLPNDRLTVDIKREYGEDVGEYKLLCGTINDHRYNIIFISGYLNILPSAITVRAEEKVKLYGDKDPSYTVVVVDGLLKNNDNLTSISVGNMERESGESIGLYKINQGNFSLGANYKTTFETGILEIIECDIEISAIKTSKIYGNNDVSIGFHISDGSLKFNDEFTGALSRESGETPGEYAITQGSLRLNQNYNIIFRSENFTILKRPIEIIPTTLSKIYGDEEPAISYKVVGDLVYNDVLNGKLYRETQQVANGKNENIGKYKIYSNLSHEYYEITFKEYYFSIQKRDVTFQADDKEIFYKEAMPELTYKHISGQILPGDSISGYIYKIPGDDVGDYAIKSLLSLGQNYNLIFINGNFKIKPIEIVVQAKNYEKIYGQIDPIFEYNIIQGTLYEGDKIRGNIIREEGENVGNYKLISNLYNQNYQISLVDSFLTIIPKEVYLITQVYDKVYDGTDKAYLKNPYVSGVIDEGVTVKYDKENSARFETKEIKNHIKVYLFDIVLVGEKAENYHLILPTEVYANITKETIENDTVVLDAKNQAILYDGLKLTSEECDIEKDSFKIKNHKSVAKFNIFVEEDDKVVDLDSTVTISIKLNKEILNNNNLYVYQKTSDGEYKLISSYKTENGELVITSNDLGEFFITTDNDSWLNYTAYISIGLIVFVALTIVVLVFRKRRNRKRAL